MATREEESSVYKVLVNEEGQYSLWPSTKADPAGWSEAGKVGTKEECMSFVDEVWTDMRPVSLRRQMALLASNGAVS
jgi:MbtH protein